MTGIKTWKLKGSFFDDGGRPGYEGCVKIEAVGPPLAVGEEIEVCDVTALGKLLNAAEKLLAATEKLEEALQDTVDSGYDQAGHCEQALAEWHKWRGEG